MKLHLLFFVLLFFPLLSVAQPTIDGDLSDASYLSIGTKQNSNSGFGSNIDVTEIVYMTRNGTGKLYLGVKGKLNTGSGDGIGIMLNVMGTGAPSGAAAGSNLGINTPGDFHYINDGGGGQTNLSFKADFEVDYLMALRPANGGTTTDMFVGDHVGAANAVYIASTADLSGSTATGMGLDFDGDANSGNITYAINNGGGANQGWEIEIDYSVIGATSAHTIEVFAFVISGTAFFSDVTVPGNVTTGNVGFNADFSTLSGGNYHTNAAVLPVALNKFEGKHLGTVLQLNWSTASEENNSHFDLQRSADGQNWFDLQRVEGQGFSSTLQQYEYLDQRPLPGSNYYRLKQTDFDGRSSLSEVIHLVWEQGNRVSVFPNPVDDYLTIKTDGPTSRDQIWIYNSIGRLIDQFQLEDGFQEIDTRDWIPGMYFLQLQNGLSGAGNSWRILKR